MSDQNISKKWKPWLRSILKIFVILFILSLLAIFITVWSINNYLESNEKKIVEEISFLNNGSFSFEDAKISLIKDFPYASLILNNVELYDSMSFDQGIPFLQAEELSGRLSLKNWKDKSLEIQTITIRRGEIFVTNDGKGYSTIKSLFKQNRASVKNDTSKQKININSSQIHLTLLDTKIHIEEPSKTLSIITHVNSLKSKLKIQKNQLTADTEMDMHVKDLIFKKANGSYLSGSDLKGTFHLTLKDNLIQITPFDLFINESLFTASADIPTNKKAPISINISNKEINLRPTLDLLTPKLRQTLERYDIKGPFPANAKIILNPGDPAKVIIDFSLNGNYVSVDNLSFEQVNTTGRFINRKYDNKETAVESKGNILLTLDKLTTNHKRFEVTSDLITINSNPRDKAGIKFKAHVSGPSSAISEWYQSERFFFDGGQFVLDTDIDSPIGDVKDILLQSSAELSLTDVSVLYKPSNTSIPVHELKLSKNAGDANFYLKSSTLLQDYDYSLNGVLQNLSALLVDFANENATSDVIFRANKMSWSDFVSIFSLARQDDQQLIKNEKETKRTMKGTIKGIYKKFMPSLNIQIDTFEYFDKVMLYDLQTGASFTDENTLSLIETTFRLDQGKVNLNMSLDLSEELETNFSIDLLTENINIEELLPTFDYFNVELLKTQSTIPDDLDLTMSFSGRINDLTGLISNTATGAIQFESEGMDNLIGKIIFEPNPQADAMISTLQLEGNPLLFNDFFKNDKFIFQDTGRFSTTFNFEGNVRSFDQMLQESVVDLTIKDGAVHNLDVDVIFPLNDLELTLQQDTAEFNLYMYSDFIDRELYLTGQLDNLSELLFANAGKQLQTTVVASSPKINLSHAVDIFETSPDTIGLQSSNQIDNKLKQLAKDMLNRFNPHLDVILDTFIINDNIKLHQLTTGVDMIDSSILILKETMFTFFDSEIKLNAEFDISNIEEAPFTANFETTALDLEKTLIAFNYFGSSSMKNAKTLTGQLTLNLDLKSSIKGIELIEEKTKAIIDIELNNLELQGIDVIDKVAARLFAKQLLKDIKFAPITNTITITGSHIDIPLMEIQSTGIDLFVEGYVDNKKNTNVWLSVPLDNITRNPTKDIPEKRGYAATKRKVYLEVISDEEGEVRTKFRIRKKKFYDHRGISDQFKEDKKRYRTIRKNKKTAKTSN